MAKTHRFFSHHAHEFLRVAACTPVATVGDIAANAAAAIALAKRGHDEACDLLVFPELSISSYAIDDLHLQDAIQRATDAALAEIAAATAKLRPCCWSAPRSRATGGSIIARWRSIAGASWASCPRRYLPNYREYYEKRWFVSGEGTTGTIDDRVARPTCRSATT